MDQDVLWGPLWPPRGTVRPEGVWEQEINTSSRNGNVKDQEVSGSAAHQARVREGPQLTRKHSEMVQTGQANVCLLSGERGPRGRQV
jgi:hypothetical protein